MKFVHFAPFVVLIGVLVYRHGNRSTFVLSTPRQQVWRDTQRVGGVVLAIIAAIVGVVWR